MIRDEAPIIATLTLDAISQATFDALRRRYFPPSRLVVGAHVTLFHALPGGMAREIGAEVAAACAGTARFEVHLQGVRFLGRGVALDLSADAALLLRNRVRAAFLAHLTPQDRAGWRPHVTVQNKVSGDQARQTWQALQGFACSAPICAEGVALWRYLGGPWEAIEEYRFEGSKAGGAVPASPDPPSLFSGGESLRGSA